MDKKLLQLKDVSKYYHSGDLVTLGLNKVNVSFDNGEFVAVIGESGSGKSTLLNVISGIDTYEDGEMYFNNEETSCFTSEEWDKYRKDNIAFIFQDYNLIDSYTVLQNVEAAIMEKYPDSKFRRQRALAVIEQVGLTSHIKHRCTKLSGGQKQRVAIARALAKDAPILIADEPTGNLDEETSQAIIELLSSVCTNKLLIMVTHSYEDIKDYADRIIQLSDGKITEDKLNINVKKDIHSVKIIADNFTIQYNKRERRRNTISILNKLAVSNIISTPRRSLFLMGTGIISIIIFLIYVILTANIIMMPPETNYYGDRKDTVIVYKADRSLLNNEDKELIKSAKGVKSAMLNYSFYNRKLQPKTPLLRLKRISEHNITVLNKASYTDKYVEYGRLPEKDDEILITYSDRTQPREDMIGQQVEFMYYQAEAMVDDRMVYKEFTVSYTVVGYSYHSELACYLTEQAIEALSEKYLKEKANYSTQYLRLYRTDNLSICFVKMKESDIIYDDSVEKDEIIFVYDDTYQINPDSPKTSQDVLYIAIKSGSEITYGKLFNTFNREIIDNDKYSFIISNQNVNSEFYERFYEGQMVFILNPDHNFRSDEKLSKTNSQLVILDMDYNVQKTIRRLENSGYRVIYKFDAPFASFNLLDLVLKVIMTIIIGLVLIAIGTLLYKEIYSALLKNKKKYYNNLRILGYDNKSIKLLSYLEFIIINTVSMLLVILVLVIGYAIIMMSHNFKLINLYKQAFPYGLFHYSSIIIFLSVYILLLLQSLWMTKMFHKKLYKDSIKTSLTMI